jgi:endonuclease/exonuclease/phosphatase family metal-dependent hydrolase
MEKAADHRRERSRHVIHRRHRAGLQSSRSVGVEQPITIVSWNVQGAQGVDVDGVADVLRAAAPDVVLVQEVGWLQSLRVARRLGMARRWVFKHWRWPGPEGLAVLTPHPLVDVQRFVLRREAWWDWRRRVAIGAVLDRSGESIAVLNIHLSPHDDQDDRRREAATVLDRAAAMSPSPIIAGDYNDLPGGPGPGDFAAAGWLDGWSIADPPAVGDGATNWTAGERLGRPPTQRIDYVFFPPGWRVVEAAVLGPPDQLDWFAERSDHLPVRAVAVPAVPER